MLFVDLLTGATEPLLGIAITGGAVVLMRVAIWDAERAPAARVRRRLEGAAGCARRCGRVDRG